MLLDHHKPADGARHLCTKHAEEYKSEETANVAFKGISILRRVSLTWQLTPA
jgi:hypothetical protein